MYNMAAAYTSQRQTTCLIDRHVRLTAESEFRRKYTRGGHTLVKLRRPPVWLDNPRGESLG